MGKKRKRTKKISKGIHSAISKSIVQAVRKDVTNIDKAQNKLDAWKAGKNPWVTVENIGGPADRLFRRVRANSLWGNPKNLTYNIYLTKKGKNASSLY